MQRRSGKLKVSYEVTTPQGNVKVESDFIVSKTKRIVLSAGELNLQGFVTHLAPPGKPSYLELHGGHRVPLFIVGKSYFFRAKLMDQATTWKQSTYAVTAGIGDVEDQPMQLEIDWAKMAVMEAKAETLFLGLIKIKIPLLISKIKEYLLLKMGVQALVRINLALLQKI